MVERHLLLITSKSISLLHRIRMTELWNFYLGGPVELYDISPTGAIKKTILGNDISANHEVSYIVSPGHWIGARPFEGTE